MKYILSLLVTLFIFTGCASKKTNQNSSSAQLDPSPMSFDVGGSDSQKIEGLNSIHFAFDRSGLDEQSRTLLQKNVAWLKSHPNTKLQIEGHCDQRGSIEYNLSLGERRAKAAMAFMLSQGIEKERLTVISYGKEKPLATGDSEEDYAKNRRDNFVPLKN